MSRIEDDITRLQEVYKSSSNKDKLYEDLLQKYKEAKERIAALEDELRQKTNSLPSREDIDAMSGMLELINKLDESTIEKLNKFGGKKI